MESSSGSVLWFTGLSGSGKTTTAMQVCARLKETGRPVELLDGDAIRAVIGKGLGFSREDRMENIQRMAYIANLLSGHGITVLVSAITPYKEMRDYLRSHVNGYVEVYVNCSLEQCEARDVKGLYAKARRQEIPQFTGISDAYEVPEQADLIIDSEHQSVDANTELILDWFKRHRLVAQESIEAGKEPLHEEERAIR